MDFPVTRSFRPGTEELKRLGRLLLMTALFCVLVAALLTLVKPGEGDFWRNLWFSEFIGLWVSGSAAMFYRLPWMKRLPPGRGAVVACVLGIPLGYVMGYTTAFTLLGEPIRILGLPSSRMLAATATTLSVAFLGYLAWLRHRLVDEATARAEAQRLAVESELRMLRAQLEPHMLFNSLANVRSLVTESPQDAQHMLDLLITYLRGALASSRAGEQTLKGEFTQLEAYLEVMVFRLGSRLSYRTDLPQELECRTVPTLLLQPLVENAIKHGIEPKVGGGQVLVSAREVDGSLELCVEDSGLGVDPELNLSGERASYGLVHVRDRLRAMYGNRASLNLCRLQPHGTRALVRMPL